MKQRGLLAAWRRGLRRGARSDGEEGGAGRTVERQPTPIYVSARVLAGIVALVVVVIALFLYAAPTVPVVALGGMALAIVLSFPVRALSHVMPRTLAILVTVLGLLGLITLALFYLVPLLIQQLRDLVVQVPIIANQANRLLLDLIDFLDERQLLPGSDPEAFGRSLVNDLFDRAQALTENLLRGLVGFIPRAFGFGVALFGVLFVGVYLLVDVRMVKAAYLRAAPRAYRRDARDLWNAFGESLSRYLGGLAVVVAIQGVLAALALYLLDVPFAILLGAWVSATAIIPYLGAFIGGIPAVIVAAVFEDPSPTIESTTTRVILVIVAYTLIQQFEGNFLTPRIQGNALHVHPILVLLAVIGGGELAGLAGVVFAVPAVAVLRVFFDFLRVRLKTKPE
ncbi:MAG TPA: AI-2E family transporter [Rubrobacter sp.]|nr:AI-2E family transporter [Rubrobacter sp.]